ncbi:ammosamide/lymphostin RiPP family protein [Streptomyces sp. NPDC002785]|uniref:ammosamide/lymphostin RiPP family protein n=1 Tax=Streptomyces sp. NPDC002785 TaxID=3154543 RepID=UPI003319E3D3
MEHAMEDTTKSTSPGSETTADTQEVVQGTEKAPASAAEQDAQAPQAEASEDTELEALDDLDDVDFDLDEVENKIAPLALAVTELSRW